MKKLFLFICLFSTTLSYAQIDKEQLALAISKADEANTEKLKSLIWKRYSIATVDGEVKLKTTTEFSFNEKGEIQTKMIDAESTEKDKSGLRGKMQKDAVEKKMDYVEKALELSLAYTFMSKGQLLDFFEKAIVIEEDGIISASAKNVYVTGDQLTIKIDAATNLYIHKRFTSLLGEDPIDGEIKYEKFSSGVNHGSETILNLPAKKTRIDSKNQDYSQRVN